MRKYFVFLCAFSIMLLTACGGFDLSDEEAQAYIDKGKDVVELLNNGDYEDVYDMFNEDMEDDMSLDNLEENLAPIIEEAGTFEEFSKASIEEREGLYGVVLVTEYSDDEIVFAVSLDDDKDIGGLFAQ